MKWGGNIKIPKYVLLIKNHKKQNGAILYNTLTAEKLKISERQHQYIEENHDLTRLTGLIKKGFVVNEDFNEKRSY